MSKKPYRTDRQKEIMGIILAEMSEGRKITLKEIYARTTYGSSYGAVRKSLAALVEAGMLVRERAGRSMNFVPTDRGSDWFRPRMP